MREKTYQRENQKKQIFFNDISASII